MIKKKSKKKYIYLLIAIAVVSYFFLDRNKPSLKAEIPSYIGLKTNFVATVFDKDSGIKRVKLFIKKNEKTYLVFEEKIEKENFRKNEKIEYDFTIEPEKLGLKNGEAKLFLEVTDYSLNFFLRGNKNSIVKDITIDKIPPKIELLTNNHTVSIGGTGIAIYNVSEPSSAGIHIGENFYPAYSIKDFDDKKTTYLNLFAYKYDIKEKPLIYIEVKDKAQNTTKLNLNLYTYGGTNKKDTLFVSNNFLRSKLSQYDFTNIKDNTTTLVDKFIYVNNTIRRENNEKILTLGENTEKAILWKDAFFRMPKTKTMAYFADTRNYSYNGKIVDTQTHLGIDLASTKKAAIPATNNGKVVFAEELGIYGKTIVIDHGLGLFSTYSHLSHIDVKLNQFVEKGDIIGKTGTTGMAGGDHLHFAVFVHNTFVNPLEWFDNEWIKKHIINKINSVEEEQTNENL